MIKQEILFFLWFVCLYVSECMYVGHFLYVNRVIDFKTTKLAIYRIILYRKKFKNKKLVIDIFQKK